MGDVVPDFIEQITVGNIITWITLIAGIWLILKKIGPVVKKLADTLDDFHGEKARPGVKARPGIMERLGDQDDALVDIGHKVSHISGNQVEVLGVLEQLKGRADQNSKGIHKAQKHTLRVETMLLQHIHDSQIWIADLGRNAAHYNFVVPDWPVRPPETLSNHDDDADSVEGE